MPAQLEPLSTSTSSNFNRCRIRTSYRYHIAPPPQCKDTVQQLIPEPMVEAADTYNQPNSPRIGIKNKEILLKHQKSNGETNEYYKGNVVTIGNKSIMKHAGCKNKKHVTLNVPQVEYENMQHTKARPHKLYLPAHDDTVLPNPLNHLLKYDEEYYNYGLKRNRNDEIYHGDFCEDKYSSSVESELRSDEKSFEDEKSGLEDDALTDYKELNDDINMQYMEFSKLIKLKEDNVLLKEEILALKANLTRKELEIDKYKEIIKKLLKRKDVAGTTINQNEDLREIYLDRGNDSDRNGQRTNRGNEIVSAKSEFIANEITQDNHKMLASRMAEKINLKRISSHLKNRPSVTGPDISRGVKNSSIMDHLVEPLVATAEWNNIYKTSFCHMSGVRDKLQCVRQPNEQLYNPDNNLLVDYPNAELKTHTAAYIVAECNFVENRGYKSRADKMAAQVEVLRQNLQESKYAAEDLSSKLNRSESSLASFQRMYHVTHQTNVILEVLLALKESQLTFLVTRASENNKESAYNSCETCSVEIGAHNPDSYDKDEQLQDHHSHSLPLLTALHHKMRAEQMANALLNLVESRYSSILKSPQAPTELTQTASASNLLCEINQHTRPRAYCTFNSLSSRGSTSTGNSSGKETCNYYALECDGPPHQQNPSFQNLYRQRSPFSRENERRLKTFLRLIKIRECHLKQTLLLHLTSPPTNNDHMEDGHDSQLKYFTQFYRHFCEDRYGSNNCNSENNQDHPNNHNSAEDLIFKSLDIQRFIDNLIMPIPYNNVVMNMTTACPIYEDPTKCLMTTDEGANRWDSEQLSLENAIILLELFETKEELSRIKEQKYYMERDKNLSEIKLAIQNNLEVSLKTQINSLEADLSDSQSQNSNIPRLMIKGDKVEIVGNFERGIDGDENLKQSLLREYRLRKQIEELMNIVENISSNSEVRYQNAMDVIMELKHSNMFLIEKCDKLKIKYGARMKGILAGKEIGMCRSENELLQSDDMNNETDL